MLREISAELRHRVVTLVVVAELAIKSTWQTGRDFIECLQNVNRPTDTAGERDGEMERRVARERGVSTEGSDLTKRPLA